MFMVTLLLRRCPLAADGRNDGALLLQGVKGFVDLLAVAPLHIKMKKLDVQFRPKEQRARQRRTVDVGGVAFGTAVEVALVAIEEVLHAEAELQLGAFPEGDAVGGLER